MLPAARAQGRVLLGEAGPQLPQDDVAQSQELAVPVQKPVSPRGTWRPVARL